MSTNAVNIMPIYSCLPNKRGATAIYFEENFHATCSY